MSTKGSFFKSINDAQIKKLSAKRIYFGHQSVGFNIIDGIQDLLQTHTKTNLRIVETTKASDFNEPVLGHSTIGQNTDPGSKIDAFSKAIFIGFVLNLNFFLILLILFLSSSVHEVSIICCRGDLFERLVHFFLGRRKGKAWLNKNARFRDKYARIDRNLDKYPILIFLVYRFMYGFRTIAPLVIGASKTKTSKFLILSAISTLIGGIT